MRTWGRILDHGQGVSPRTQALPTEGPGYEAKYYTTIADFFFQVQTRDGVVCAHSTIYAWNNQRSPSYL